MASRRSSAQGQDLTIVTLGPALYTAIDAADELAAQFGLSAEVIDLRSANPLNYEPLAESVRKTGKVLLASDAVERGSVLQTVAAEPDQLCFDDLDAPPVVVGSRNWITPAAELEAMFFPQPGLAAGRHPRADSAAQRLPAAANRTSGELMQASPPRHLTRPGPPRRQPRYHWDCQRTSGPTGAYPAESLLEIGLPASGRECHSERRASCSSGLTRQEAEVYHLPGRDFYLCIGPHNSAPRTWRWASRSSRPGAAPAGHIHPAEEEVIHIMSGTGELVTPEGTARWSRAPRCTSRPACTMPPSATARGR